MLQVLCVWRVGEEGSHGDAGNIGHVGQGEMEQGATSHVKPWTSFRYIWEHLEAVHVGMESRKLASNPSTRASHGGGDGEDMVGRGANIHVEREVRRSGQARVALDQGVNSRECLHASKRGIHLAHVAKGERRD